MTLHIKEIAWGINRCTGARSERMSGEISAPCAVGEVPPFGQSKRRFVIDEVRDKSIVLSVHCVVSKYDQTWVLNQGETKRFCPVSYDGGHKYEFKLL